MRHDIESCDQGGEDQYKTWLDEMKTSMHRMIARHLVCFSSNASTLLLMLIS